MMTENSATIIRIIEVAFNMVNLLVLYVWKNLQAFHKKGRP
jgi:hypothetical protein